MRQIVPVQVWFQGNEVLATKLEVIISYDNLSTYAVFTYELYRVIQTQGVDIDGNPILIDTDQMLIGGDVNMGGDDYQNWDDSNDAAYQYVASKINVTLV
jgi:hypothetical protein